METSSLSERFSRQIILPGVGLSGQEKWANTQIFLAGEGAALQAAKTAFETTGASKILLLDSESLSPLPDFSIAVVLTEDMAWRKKLSRSLRSAAKPALFAWPAGSGYALFLTRHQGGQCPCLECFEIMNPKAFTKGEPSVQRQAGALAVSETLQWVLKGESLLEGKVWVTSLEEGVSFHHQVHATYKCPAHLLEEGAAVIP